MEHKVSHTILRGDVYYFNYRTHANDIVRLSLKTKQTHKAKKLVSRIMDKIEETHVSSRVLKAIVKEEVQRVINRVTASLNPLSDECQAEIQRFENYKVATGEPTYSELSQKLHGLKNYTFEDYIKEHTSRFNVEKKLKSLNPTSKVEHSLIRHWYETFNNYLTELHESKQSEKSKIIDNLAETFELAPKQHQVTAPSVATSPTMTYRAAMKLYTADRKSYLYTDPKQSKEYSLKKVNEDLGWVETVGCEYFKDSDINAIDSNKFDQLLMTLSAYPKRKIQPWKGMTVTECLQLAESGDVPEDIRQDKQLVRIKSAFNKFFTWLYDNHKVNENPVATSRFKKFTDLSKRGTFSPNELTILRSYYDNLELDDYGCAFYLQLFSGMRNAEFLAIKPTDIKQENGVTYFHVKGTKTENAERRIPVHPFLVERGVITYLNNENGLKVESSGLSMRFKRLLSDLEIGSINGRGQLLSFYSLRHNFMTSLAGANATDININVLVGHAQSGAKNDYIDYMNVGLKSLKDIVYSIPS